MNQTNDGIYEDKNDAINAAFVLSHQVGMPCYAFDGRHGWQVAERKPTLRYGKVLECYNGKIYNA